MPALQVVLDGGAVEFLPMADAIGSAARAFVRVVADAASNTNIHRSETAAMVAHRHFQRSRPIAPHEALAGDALVRCAPPTIASDGWSGEVDPLLSPDQRSTNNLTMGMLINSREERLAIEER